MQLELSLAGAAQKPARISIGSLRPTLRRRHWLDLIRLQLERLPLSGGVVDFRVWAAATAPLCESQPDLFGDGEERDSRRELSVLLDRLSSRLGRKAVLQPELRADHQPERALAFHPVIGAANSKPRRREVPTPRCRPMRVMRQPVRVAVTSVVPDGPPIRLRWGNAERRIVHCDGPERIETGWWRESPIRRDYYRVDLEGGERHWLFRALDDGDWFLHGDF